MSNNRDQEFEEFVRRRRSALLRTATVMTGDAHLAEDLVQTALVRLYLAWGKARRTQVDAYARRTLVNCLIDETRRPHRRERIGAAIPDRAGQVDTGSAGSVIGPDDDLLAALTALPIGMRTAVVLRHVEGLDVTETAAAMGCTPGNVKSQTARGLERLRDHLNHPRTEGAAR